MNEQLTLDVHAFKPLPPLSQLAGRALRRRLGTKLVSLTWEMDCAADVAAVYAVYGVRPVELSRESLVRVANFRIADFAAAVSEQDEDKAAASLGALLYLTYSMALQAGVALATPAFKAPGAGQMSNKHVARISIAWLNVAECGSPKNLWRGLMRLRDTVLAAAHDAGIYMPLVWDELQARRLAVAQDQMNPVPTTEEGETANA